MSILENLEIIKRASKSLRTSSLEKRNQTLNELATLLEKEEKLILEANLSDLNSLAHDVTPAFRDRLSLNPSRIQAMRKSLLQVAALPDPLGEVVEETVLANKLVTQRVRSPLGVIFMIFESRPNVAIEAFSLALKSGNAIILRGGKESKLTTEIFYSLMSRALLASEMDSNCVLGITDPNRDLVLNLLSQKKWIDVVVPRGGEKLIEYVVEHSKIPIIKNDRGMCHVYLHADARPEIAIPIVENAKKQRPGVCNSMETLLIHESIADLLLPKLYKTLSEEKNPVTWFGCERTCAVLSNRPHVKNAGSLSFDTEYLDLKLNCKVVQNELQAMEHIERHGSRHSEAIVTEDYRLAKFFQTEVDAAAVYWNASTRFTDGFELGLGGELGISTQKLHVRGPIGLKELTSIRWVITGTGQIRT